MKRILWILVVLVLLALAALYLGVDALVKRGIEEGTSYATGVPTNIEAVDLGLFSGNLDVRELQVENPDGYESPYFFALRNLDLEVQPRSLLEPVVRVPELTIEGVRLNLERSGRTTNFNTILDNLQRLGGADGEPRRQPEQKEDRPEKRFIIDRLRISDVTARAILASELDTAGQLEVPVPPVTVNDVGADSGGVTVAQLAALITRELLVAASKKIELPPDLSEALNRRLQQIQGLEGAVREEADRTRKEAEQRAREELEQRKEKLLEEGRRLLEPE